MDDFEKFYNKALRFLSFRPRSEKEIVDNLKRKKASLSIINKITTKLKEQKFIDNKEFAKWWIESRLRFKPRSINLIKRELLQKGIAKEVIEKTISNDEFLISNELEQAKKIVEKRIKRFRNKFGMTREEKYQKLGSFLARRGFDWETIKKAIDEALAKMV